MNSLQSVVLLVAVSSAAAQFGQFGGFGDAFGAQGGVNQAFEEGFFGQDGRASFFDGALRNGIFNNGALNAQGNDRAAVEVVTQGFINEKAAANKQAGDQVFVNQDFKVEEIANNAHAANLDVIDNHAGVRNLGIQIVDEKAYDVGNKLSVAEGVKEDAGVRAFGDAEVGAQTQHVANVAANAGAQKFGGVKANAANDQVVNAAENTGAQQQTRVKAQDFFDSQFGAGNNIFGRQGAAFEDFGQGGFGFLGRRRR